MPLLLAIIAGAFAITIFGKGSNMLANIELKCIRSCVARSGDEIKCAHHCACAKLLIGKTLTETEIYSFEIRNKFGQEQKDETVNTLTKITRECGGLK